MGRSIIRADGKRSTIARLRLVQSAQRLERIAKIVMCRRKIRLEGDGAFKARYSLLQSPKRLQRIGKLKMCIDVVRPQRQGPAITCCRLAVPILLAESKAEIHMRLGKLGIQRDGLLETGQRLVGLALSGQRDTAVVMRLGVIQSECQVPAPADNRLFSVLLYREYRVEPGASLDIIRPERKELAVACRGLVQSAQFL